MVSKVAFVFCLFAIIYVCAEEKAEESAEESGPVEYEFSYSVHDDHTKDIKSHREHRKDDKVVGSYELIDSDGFKRLVEYKADDHNGFTAVVHREPTDIKVPIPVHEQHVAEASDHHVQHLKPLVHYTKIVPATKIIVAEPKVVAVRAAPAHYHTNLHRAQNHVSYHGSNVAYHY